MRHFFWTFVLALLIGWALMYFVTLDWRVTELEKTRPPKPYIYDNNPWRKT